MQRIGEGVRERGSGGWAGNAAHLHTRSIGKSPPAPPSMAVLSISISSRRPPHYISALRNPTSTHKNIPCVVHEKRNSGPWSMYKALSVLAVHLVKCGPVHTNPTIVSCP